MRSPTRSISFAMSWSRGIMPSMRPDSMIALPRSIRLHRPGQQIVLALEKIVQDLLSRSASRDLLQDHLLRRPRADAGRTRSVRAAPR
jgi:hypothetical protein